VRQSVSLTARLAHALAGSMPKPLIVNGRASCNGRAITSLEQAPMQAHRAPSVSLLLVRLTRTHRPYMIRHHTVDPSYIHRTVRSCIVYLGMYCRWLSRHLVHVSARFRLGPQSRLHLASYQAPQDLWWFTPSPVYSPCGLLSPSADAMYFPTDLSSRGRREITDRVQI
jgi:hypothetical protein